MKRKLVFSIVVFLGLVLLSALTVPVSHAESIDTAEMFDVTCDGFTIATRSDPGTIDFTFELQRTNPLGPIVSVSGSFQQTVLKPGAQTTLLSWVNFPPVPYLLPGGTLDAGDYVIVNSPQDDPGRTVTLSGFNTIPLHYSAGPILCVMEPFCGDGNIDPGEQCDDGNNIDGDGCSADCTFEFGRDGCTPGYWKQVHHFDSWTAPYTPNTMFADVFDNAFPGMTLKNVLRQGGGHLKALGRHTVAALLNAASDDVSYDLSASQVITLFNDKYPDPDGDYNGLKNTFEYFNELGCPIN